jgi:sortase (surface protein transpeptidase)
MHLPPRLLFAALLALALAACAAPPAALAPAPPTAAPPTLTPRRQALTATMRPAAPPPTVAPTAPPTAPPPPTVAPTAPPPTDTPPSPAPPAPTDTPPSPAPPPPTDTPPSPAPPPPTDAPAPLAAAVEASSAPGAPPPLAVAADRAALSAPQRIVIESIGLDRTLVDVGLDPENRPVVPDHDVAWYGRSARPGAGENVVVWGHALRFQSAPDLPAPLERVREAHIGDRVTLVTADGVAHRYVIAEQIWATPDQVAYILPSGDERLTIVNCIGDYVVDASGAVVTMTHRLITIARPEP